MTGPSREMEAKIRHRLACVIAAVNAFGKDQSD
jgi:hypothetical protein